ncbi:lipase family protein [Microbacterium hominis]|uniref:lipase family protein n=1 Tax=Microbacterium hominis TaxID=162426 RepID=UPI0007686161|nr:lipase family protein [Microbacterium hominis]KXC05913.1 hypothetical protein MhomT_08085 [Microbacterium hominis]
MARHGILQDLPLWRLHARMPEGLRIALAIATVALGAVIVWRPTTALDVLALLLGGGMVLTGVLEANGRAEERGGRWWRWPVAIGWFALGLFVLVWPGLTVRAVADITGILLLLNGGIGVLSAFRAGRGWDERISDAAFGATGLIFGVLALVWPDITLLVVAVVFGASLIIRGSVDLWGALRGRRDDGRGPRRPVPQRRWGRTAMALGSVALAVTVAIVTTPLRDGSTVVDEFYAAPRDVPSEPGRLIRAEEFTNEVPAKARAWRILYTTTGVDGRLRVASGMVMVPRDRAEGTRWPVVQWNHGTTGFAQHCAPTLQQRPFWVGAMYYPRKVVAEGWAMVATDYSGLGTTGPHPYLFGEASAWASLDAVRAAWELEDAHLSRNTVIWGHSQGGGAALWSGALARSYAPGLWVRGVAALAPAVDPLRLVRDVSQVAGGTIFASYAFAAYEAIDPEVTYDRYIRPGAQTVVRAMSQRCLNEPTMALSVLAVVGLSEDRDIFADDPTTGPLGARLRQSTAPALIGPPVFVGQGRADTIISVGAQDDAVARMCDAGQRVDYRRYDGYEHAQIMEGYAPTTADLLAWTRARFESEPVPDGCTTNDG